MSDQNAQPPVVTVVSGSPTSEELAAIITVVSAVSGSGGDSDTEPRGDRPQVGGWKSYARVLRREISPSPGAWRHSHH